MNVNYSNGKFLDYDAALRAIKKAEQLEFFDYLCLLLHKAYAEAKRHKLNTMDLNKFDVNAEENLYRLALAIQTRQYKPQRGIAFVHKNTVYREIVAAPMRDRIVHHAIYDLTADWWDARLSPFSFSCRKGKGTLYGIMTVQRHLKKATHGGRRKAIVFKGDLSGYFMSLPRAALYERAKWGADRQFKDNKIMREFLNYLWYETISDDPMDGITYRGKRSDWNLLPESKIMCKQPPGVGIVIGNLTSQELSNIYLDLLDRFITIELGYKFYGRYVDDFVIIVPETQKANLKRDIERIKNFIKSLGLTLHPKKSQLLPAVFGVPFTGARIYEDHIIPSVRLYKNLKKITDQIEHNRISLSSIESYLGHFSHFDTYRLESAIMTDLGWDYI